MPQKTYALSAEIQQLVTLEQSSSSLEAKKINDSYSNRN